MAHQSLDVSANCAFGEPVAHLKGVVKGLLLSWLPTRAGIYVASWPFHEGDPSALNISPEMVLQNGGHSVLVARVGRLKAPESEAVGSK